MQSDVPRYSCKCTAMLHGLLHVIGGNLIDFFNTTINILVNRAGIASRTLS